MRILIAGGTGVIGKRLVPKLVDLKHEVGVITRSEKKSEWVRQQRATPHLIDIFNQEDVIKAAQDYEAILHLATAIPTKPKTKAKDWEMNMRLRTEGTKNLIAASLSTAAKLYIQESFSGLYGHHGSDLLDESFRPIIPVQSRVKLKSQDIAILNNIVEMEQIVEKAVAKQSLPAIILRFGMFYSYDSTNIPALANGKFPIVGKGDSYWSMISVDDAVDSIIAALNNYEENIGETFNIVDDHPATSAEILNYSAIYIGKKKASKVPGFLVRLLFGKFSLNFLSSSARISNKKAKQKLKWKLKYPSWKEGIPAEIDRYRSSSL